MYKIKEILYLLKKFYTLKFVVKDVQYSFLPRTECTVSTRVKVSSRNHLTASRTTSRPRSYLEDIRLVAEVQGYLDGLMEAALAAALTAQRHAGRDTRHDTTRTCDTPPVSRDWLSGISGTSYLLPPPPPPRLSCFSTLLYSTLLFRHCVHQWWPKETSQCSGQTPIKIICRLFGRFRLSGRVWLKAAYYRGLTLIVKFRRSSSMMVYFWFLLVHTLDPL